MKAITLDAFGDPSVLKYGEITTPEPDAGEVLIKVHNVSVNVTLDIALRKGNYPIKPDLPHVMGIDPVGEIVDVGREVSGDRVLLPGRHEVLFDVVAHEGGTIVAVLAMPVEDAHHDGRVLATK